MQKINEQGEHEQADHLSAERKYSRSAAPSLPRGDSRLARRELGVLMPFRLSREARAIEAAERRPSPAVLVAEPATVSLRREASTDRLKGSRTPPNSPSFPGSRDHGTVYTLRNLKLKRRISNCWFGLGVKSTYFCSP